MLDPQISDAIIKLHEAARAIEEKVGVGQLSEDVRKCADRLTSLTKEL